MMEQELLADRIYAKQVVEPLAVTVAQGVRSYQVSFDTTFWPDGTLMPVQTWFSTDDGVTWTPGGSGTLGKAGPTARIPNTAFLGCTFNRLAPPNLQLKVALDFPNRLRTSCKLRAE